MVRHGRAPQQGTAHTHGPVPLRAATVTPPCRCELISPGGHDHGRLRAAVAPARPHRRGAPGLRCSRTRTAPALTTLSPLVSCVWQTREELDKSSLPAPVIAHAGEAHVTSITDEGLVLRIMARIPFESA